MLLNLKLIIVQMNFNLWSVTVILVPAFYELIKRLVRPLIMTLIMLVSSYSFNLLLGVAKVLINISEEVCLLGQMKLEQLGFWAKKMKYLVIFIESYHQ